MAHKPCLAPECWEIDEFDPLKILLIEPTATTLAVKPRVIDADMHPQRRTDLVLDSDDAHTVAETDNDLTDALRI